MSTRTRHAIEYDLTAGVKSDGHILGKAMEAISNQGGYAFHGHSIVANGATAFRHLYDIENVRASAFTVYTNIPVGGAMRGYGIPQFCFAQECMMDDIARKLSMDPLELREKNVHRGYFADPFLKEIAANTNGAVECMENFHIENVQDTDQAPFDTGAEALSLEDGEIYMNNEPVMNLESLAMEYYYSLTDASVLSAEVSRQVKNNTIAFGCCFAEVEVDISLGRVRILDMINVHDRGILINPMLAKMQVHSGMSMGIGYGLSEQLLVDSKNGRVLTGTLLDYKLPTMMDAPDLSVDFVKLDDPTGPYGNKALGEPPAIPVAPAIRNAVLHATGVAVNEVPLSPQRCFEAFKAAGLL